MDDFIAYQPVVALNVRMGMKVLMKTILKSENTGIDKLGQVGMLISRLVIGYLWFDQLLWKLPPSFERDAQNVRSPKIRLLFWNDRE